MHNPSQRGLLSQHVVNLLRHVVQNRELSRIFIINYGIL